MLLIELGENSSSYGNISYTRNVEMLEKFGQSPRTRRAESGQVWRMTCHSHPSQIVAKLVSLDVTSSNFS